MIKALFYVSRRTTPASSPDRDLAGIVAVGLSRNTAAGLTGALISTDDNFAQLLEGPDGPLDEIMTSILADRRHREVTILDVRRRPRRWYPDWALAYAGSASYMSRRITPLLQTSPDPEQLKTMLRVMKAFAPKP